MLSVEWEGSRTSPPSHPHPFPSYAGRKEEERSGSVQSSGEEERSCEHVGLGMHHSRPSIRIAFRGGNLSSPLMIQGPWAPGPKLGFLNSAVTHLSSSHHCCPWPCICWCLFPSLGPSFGVHEAVPWCEVLGEKVGMRIFYAVIWEVGTDAFSLNSITWI